MNCIRKVATGVTFLHIHTVKLTRLTTTGDRKKQAMIQLFGKQCRDCVSAFQNLKITRLT
jgi:hypothetical protein